MSHVALNLSGNEVTIPIAGGHHDRYSGGAGFGILGDVTVALCE